MGWAACGVPLSCWFLKLRFKPVVSDSSVACPFQGAAPNRMQFTDKLFHRQCGAGLGAGSRCPRVPGAGLCCFGWGNRLGISRSGRSTAA